MYALTFSVRLHRNSLRTQPGCEQLARVGIISSPVLLCLSPLQVTKRRLTVVMIYGSRHSKQPPNESIPTCPRSRTKWRLWKGRSDGDAGAGAGASDFSPRAQCNTAGLISFN